MNALLKQSSLKRRHDGIGRLGGLKNRWWKHRVGSSPTADTTYNQGVFRMLKNDKNIYCPCCRRNVDSIVRTVSETYPVKGEDTTIEAEVRFCSRCGSDIWDEELDPQNLEKAYTIYRQKHGLAPNASLRN